MKRLLLLMAMMTCLSVSAQTIYYVSPTGTGDGTSSWATASNDLQAVINQASAGSEIWVAAGTYVPNRPANDTGTIKTSSRATAFVMKKDVQIYGGFDGTETNLLDRNWKNNITILSGNKNTGDSLDNCYHVVVATGEMGTACLDGFTVQDGYANATTSIIVNNQVVWHFNGGGVYCNGSSPLLTNLIVTNNKSGLANTTNGCGAGVYCNASSPLIKNIVIKNNTSTKLGGGLYCYESSPIVVNTLISNNTAKDGGGVYSIAKSITTITNVTIANNIATNNGGGVYRGNDFGNSQLKAYNSIITGNTATVSGQDIFNSAATGYIYQYCLIGNDVDNTGVSITGTALIIDPASPFKNSASGDYSIEKISLATDKGANDLYDKITYGSFDLAGKRRVFGPNNKIDIGAYEYATPLAVDANGVAYVKKNASGTGTGESWSNAVNELADALLLAEQLNNDIPGTVKQIWVAKDTYNPLYTAADTLTTGAATSSKDNAFVLVKDIEVYGGFLGTEDLFEKRNVNNKATLDGLGSYHVVIAAGDMGTATLDGFIITKGDAGSTGSIKVNSVDVPQKNGGAITNIETSIRYANLSITQNASAADGAGVYAENSNITINNSDFTQNLTLNGNGGALCNNTSVAKITDCYFAEGNSATYGGAIYNSKSIFMNRVRITNNQGTYGAGICNVENASSTMINVLIDKNRAIYGGGIYSNKSADTLINATITANEGTPGLSGFGIYQEAGTTPLIIKNSIIWANGDEQIKTSTNANYSYSIVQDLDLSDSIGCLDGKLTTPSLNATDYSLNSNSAVINKGSNAVYDTGIFDTLDYAREKRIMYTNIDMGAYESQSNPVPPMAVFNTPDKINCPAILDSLQIEITSEGTNSTWDIEYTIDSAGGSETKTIIGINGNSYTIYVSPSVTTTFKLVSVKGADGSENLNLTDSVVITINTTLSPDASGILYVNKNASGTGNGDSWANAMKELSEALAFTKGCGATTVKEIWVAEGIYKPSYKVSSILSRYSTFILPKNVFIYGGFPNTGNPSITDRNWKTNETILSGDIGIANDSSDNCFHVVVASGDLGTTLLDGFTIQDGYCIDGSGYTVNGNIVPRGYGAGIVNIGGSAVTYENLLIKSNHAANGGGVYNFVSSPTFNKVIIRENTALYTGGGVYNDNGSPKYINTLITADSAGLQGAGLYNNNSTTKLINTTIAYNKGRKGVRGIGVCNAGASLLSIINTIVWGNGDTNVYGNTTHIEYVNSLVQNVNLLSKPGCLNGYTKKPRFIDTINCFLSANSDVINTGNNTEYDSGIYGSIDLADSVRIKKMVIDMGAYEYQECPVINVRFDNANKILCAAQPIDFFLDITQGGYSRWGITYEKDDGSKSLHNVTIDTNILAFSDTPSQDTTIYRIISITDSVSGCTNTNINDSVLIAIKTFTPSASQILYVDNSVLASGDGSSWGEAIKELADALEFVRNCPNTVEQIWVTQGVYFPLYQPAAIDKDGYPTTDRDKAFVLPKNVKIYGSFLGGEVSIDQRDLANLSVLTGDIDFEGDATDNNYHLVMAVGDLGSTVLDGFYLHYANADGLSSINVDGINVPQSAGGGIINIESSPTYTNLFITENIAVNGGGVFVAGSTSQPLFNRLRIEGNYAYENGAGVHTTSSRSTFVNSLVIGNSGNMGAGMYFDGGHDTVVNVSVLSNQAFINGDAFAFIAGSDIVLKNTVAWGLAGAQMIELNASMYNFYSSIVQDYSTLWGSGNFDGTDLKYEPNFDWDYRPTSGIINIGSNSLYDTAYYGNKDLAGNRRVIANIDLGALEVPCQSSPFIQLVSVDKTTCSGNPVRLHVQISGENISAPYKVKYSIDNGISVQEKEVSLLLNKDFIYEDPISVATTYKLISITDGSDCINDTIKDSITITPLVATPSSGIIYVDKNVSSSGDGSEWNKAIKELADALYFVNNCDNGTISEIWVTKETYYPLYKPVDTDLGGDSTTERDKTFVLPKNVKIYGGFLGGETDITQRLYMNKSTLNGNVGNQSDDSDNSYHVVISAGDIGSTILDGFIIEGGNANGGSAINLNGETIYQYYGGGIADYNTTGNYFSHSATYSNLTILFNNALEGGGIYTYGQSANLFNKLVIIDNYAHANGGGVASSNGKSSFVNSLIVNNISSTYGGGFFMSSATYDTLTNVTIANNETYVYGSGVYLQGGAKPIIQNTIIWGNIGGDGNVEGNIPEYHYSLVEGENLTTQNNSLDGTNGFNDPNFDANYIPSNNVINKGNNSLYDSIKYSSTDLANTTRIHANVIDLGAFEFQNCNFKPDVNGVLYVDSTVVVSGDGSSWTNAIKELADALHYIDICGNMNVSEIWVTKGTYLPSYTIANYSVDTTTRSIIKQTTARDEAFLLPKDIKIYGGFLGTETTISDRLFTNRTILSGDIGIPNDSTDNCYHVVVAAGEIGSILLDGFIITAGNANGVGDEEVAVNGEFLFKNRGGGLYDCNNTNHNDPAIHTSVYSNVIFRNNTAYIGGGAHLYGPSSKLFNRVSILDNSSSSDGGGVHIEMGPLTMVNSLIANNESGSYGGGINMYLNIDDSIILINTTITKNNSQTGGSAVRIFGSNKTLLYNSIIWGNKNVDNTLSGSFNYPQYSLIENLDLSSFQGCFDGKLASSNPNLDANYIPSSNVINKGDNSLYDTINYGTNDLADTARINANAIDLGAFEFQACNFKPDSNGVLYVDSTVVASGDGSSWTNAIKELADALHYINACGNMNVSQIWVAKGTYLPLYKAAEINNNNASTTNQDMAFVLPDNVKIYGGFAGTEDSLYKRNWQANETILSGDIEQDNNPDNFAYHVVIATPSKNSIHIVLDGFTIENGNANGATEISVKGNPIIAQNLGAGIYISTDNTLFGFTPLFENLIVQSNRAVNGGGGLYSNYCVPTLNKVIIRNNSTEGTGGGMYNEYSGPIIINTLLAQNTAANGGGMYSYNSDNELTNITVADNQASANGGGIYFSLSNSFVASNCILANNVATLLGQDIYDNGLYSYVAQNCLITVANMTSEFFDGLNVIVGEDPQFNADYSLKITSPAVNAGDNNFYDTVAYGSKDLADTTRIKFNTIDMGAFENQDCPAITATFLTPDTAICEGSEAKLRIAITSGIAPWQIVYTSDNGITTDTTKNILTTIDSLIVLPTNSSTYKLVSITDSVGCITDTLTSTINVTVNPIPDAENIQDTNVCLGDPLDLNNLLLGKIAIWTSLTPDIATIDENTGEVTTISIGIAKISYTLIENGCVSLPATVEVLVRTNTLPKISIGVKR